MAEDPDWPRTIKIDGKRHEIRNEWEFRQILDRFHVEQAQKLATEESKPLTNARASEVRRIKGAITRAQNRLEAVDDDIRQQEEALLMQCLGGNG